jgi:Tol biopolymer transport system component
MDADGGNLTQLTTNACRDDKPVFAPDGKTVFFRSNRGLSWDIWTMEIKTGK